MPEGGRAGEGGGSDDATLPAKAMQLGALWGKDRAGGGGGGGDREAGGRGGGEAYQPLKQAHEDEDVRLGVGGRHAVLHLLQEVVLLHVQEHRQDGPVPGGGRTGWPPGGGVWGSLGPGGGGGGVRSQARGGLWEVCQTSLSVPSVVMPSSIPHLRTWAGMCWKGG